MKPIEGLKLYEIAMLGGGLLLLVVSIWMLVVRTRRSETVWGVVPLVALSIGMIGFPVIKKIKVGKDAIEIERFVATQANATAPVLTAVQIQELELKVDEFKPRVAGSPETLLTVARAEALLGKVDDSKQTLAHALQLAPAFAPAQDLKARVSELPTGQPDKVRSAVQANLAFQPQ